MKPLDTTDRDAAADPSRPDLSLLVMGPTGTGHVTLPARGRILLGRASECDLKIDDAKLSRRHAELRCGDVLELVDLDSRNGTFLREERLAPNAPARVVVGDSITIGSTVLVVQRAKSPGERPRHVWTHGYFEARVEEECARAAQGRSAFAILRLRLEPQRLDGPTQDADAAAAFLFAEMTDADMVARYAPHEYEALFTETSPEEADARAATMERRFGAHRSSVRVAVAAFPRDGRTPEALIEHATRGVRPEVAQAANGSPPPSVRIAGGALQRMARMIERVAEGRINVLILGETGVGKEVLARRIHELSPRASMPLVSINCAALSESLLESELFGHEKGAFTGAIAAKQGLLESANGGVVFLDEVGEMALATQAKLLRVLEQREVTRVGALRPKTIDVRFFAATNRDLEAEIAKGRFRQDLYFRLNGIALTLPPLRERTDEIASLVEAFIDDAHQALGGSARPRLSPEARAALLRYQWPGNIRELRNVIERAVLLCTGAVITCEHLPVDKMVPVFESRAGNGARDVPLPALPAERAKSVTQPPAAADERQRIIDALARCAGSQSAAAKELGISRATLIRRIAEYGIPRPRKRE